MHIKNPVGDFSPTGFVEQPKFLPYIQNTCEYPTLSNGPIEGINNKIKVLKRNAYGYSSLTHFRNRILLMSKLFTPTTKKGIKQPDAA